MAFRCRYLRSRFIDRAKRLPPTHILQAVMTGDRNYLLKLTKESFSSETLQSTSRRTLQLEEMKAVHEETKSVIGGFLVIEPDGRLPWVVCAKMDRMLHKRIFHWVLKKYPAAAPIKCGMCPEPRCSQSHIATCGFLLASLSPPEIPPRFRPENLLSNPLSDLSVIARAIHL